MKGPVISCAGIVFLYSMLISPPYSISFADGQPKEATGCRGESQISNTGCRTLEPTEESKTMAENIISAEVKPTQGKSQQAALALQRLGLRVLHIGPTISVEGRQSIWEAQFHVTFETRKKPVMQEIPEREVTYQKAMTESLSLPSELEGLIADVMFVEPPEFFGGP